MRRAGATRREVLPDPKHGSKLVAKFAEPATPYYSLLHPMWTTHYGTYDHLARVQEWSLSGNETEVDPFE